MIDSYRIVGAADIDLDVIGSVELADMTVEVTDPVADYAELMELRSAASPLIARGRRKRTTASAR